MGYYFTDSVSIPYSLLSFVMGYSKNNFWYDLKKKIIPQFLILIVTCFFTNLLFLYFRKGMYNEIKDKFSKSLDTLFDENKKYKYGIDQMKADFLDKEQLYETNLKYTKDFLESFKVSDHERSRLLSAISKSISLSLHEIENLVDQILQDKKSFGFIVKQNEEIDILENIANKVQYLRSFCIKDQSNQVNIDNIIDSLVNFYAKDFYKKNLKFRVEIKTNTKVINFNNLLFYQILLSILYISIDAARSKGSITLKMLEKKVEKTEMLVVLVKDDGFYLKEDTDAYIFSNNTENSYFFNLSFAAIKNILEKFGGSINITYTNEGKIVELELPYSKFPEEVKHNVIPLKRF